MIASFHILDRSSIGNFGKRANSLRSTPVIEGFSGPDAVVEDALNALEVGIVIGRDAL